MNRVCAAFVMLFFVFASVFPSYVRASESTKDTSGTSEQTSDDMYQTAIKNKIACEGKVLSIKDFYKKESKEYRNASILYNDAMVKYNTLFELVKLAIQNGVDLDVKKHEKDISDVDSRRQGFFEVC